MFLVKVSVQIMTEADFLVLNDNKKTSVPIVVIVVTLNDDHVRLHIIEERTTQKHSIINVHTKKTHNIGIRNKTNWIRVRSIMQEQMTEEVSILLCYGMVPVTVHRQVN